VGDASTAATARGADAPAGQASAPAWLEDAVARLAADGFVAYPTETVWGLGACADRAVAVERLVAWKGRGDRNPLAVLVASLAAAEDLGCAPSPAARRLAARFWPGPMMLVVPCRGRFAPGVAREDGALGLRCSPHSIASALVERLARAGLGPLTSTSFNRSGDAPAASRAEAIRLAGSPKLDREAAGLGAPLLVAPPGYDAGGRPPSTVVDCTRPGPVILRVGAIARDAIEAAWVARSDSDPDPDPEEKPVR